MNEKIIEMEEMINQLNEWSYNYYTLDKPLVSDANYDQLYDKLVAMEQETGVILPDSPTQRVGDVILEGFEKHEHINRLYSMDKAQSFEMLLAFDKRIKRELQVESIEYVVELKFDGLSISLTYDNGELIHSSTRGNGFIGELITEQIKRIPTVPLKIGFEGVFEIGGEAIMPLSAFKAYNEQNPNEQLKNPRNAAAGAIRNLDTSTIRKRKIDAFFYNINTYPGNMFETDIEMKDFLRNNGFKVSDYYYLCNSIEEVIEKAKLITKARSDLDFMIDGVVIKVNNINYRNRLGYTNKFPRWAIAYKFEAEEAYTKLLNVEWNVGRTSKVTPTAILSPVEIDGVTIQRATLNNYDFIESKDIRINSEVLLRRSNDVIPEILSADNTFNETEIIEKPNHCPACNSELEEIGAHLYCPNTLSCRPQLLARLTHFTSKDSMNIEGISEKTISQLIDIHNIDNIADFYTLTSEDFAQLEGFKEKRISNALNSIEKSKKVSFNNFINALGILNVGVKTSMDLSMYFKDFNELRNAQFEDLINIDDIGPETALSITNFFNTKEVNRVIDRLFEQGIEILYRNNNNDNNLNGKIFVITGSFDGINRKEIEKIIISNGGKSTGSVSKNTDFLVLGENPGSKYNKALELNTKIIDLNNLYEMIGGENE